MTKISQYSTDVNITGNDKWIGSDAQNFLITKNFTPNNLASFFNENNVIDIGTSIRYRYQTLLPGEAREQGTISFETEIGPQVNFSAITTFLIAKNTLKGNTVTQYLDFLVDGKVLLSKASNINIFGYYNITSIEPWIPNTNFFVVTVDFLAGNGFISEDLDYLISLVDKAQDTPTTVWGSITGDIEDQTDLINYISSQIITPTLASVLAEGNTTGGENIVINNADAIQLENSSTLKKGTYDFGADGGISRICGVGFEDMWQSGIRHVFDSNGLIRNSTNGFNIVPDSSFDNTLRFKVDSLWTLDNGDTYKCTDASTGAAVWELVNTGTTPTLQEVTDAGNTINDNVIEFYDGGNLHGIIGGPQTFLDFNNYTSGNYKYLLDTFNGFSTYVQDETEYSVLDAIGLNFVNTIYSTASQFTVNGFSKTTIGAPISKTLFINFPTTIVGTNKTQTFQDADGIIALLSDIPSGGVTSVTATSPITSSGGATPDISTSMATNKLIGRSTAGTGVMEEITIGTGLTLSGGILNGSATGVTSVGLTMPSAFTVTNSPITSSGDIAVTGAGLVSQYVRGDGTLANFPNSTGGGSSVNYYLNGSVSQGTFGGDTYYQMSKTPILGAGTNFIRTNGAGNGYIASFITDAGDPNQLNIPGGNWNVEFYFNASSGGGSPSFYAELYKVNATNVFTLIASDSLNPEGITNGTTVDQYFSSIPVPQTSLLVTDRLAVRIFVNTGGRTITLHTENGNLSEVLTTFTTGLTALNGLTDQVQFFDVGTGATNFNISSSGDTHTFNLLFNIRRNANNSSNNNMNYNGYAVTGSAESSAVWTITRLTIAASGSITVATATNVAWTDRETTIYT